MLKYCSVSSGSLLPITTFSCELLFERVIPRLSRFWHSCSSRSGGGGRRGDATYCVINVAAHRRCFTLCRWIHSVIDVRTVFIACQVRTTEHFVVNHGVRSTWHDGVLALLLLLRLRSWLPGSGRGLSGVCFLLSRHAFHMPATTRMRKSNILPNYCRETENRQYNYVYRGS